MSIMDDDFDKNFDKHFDKIERTGIFAVRVVIVLVTLFILTVLGIGIACAVIFL